MRKARNDAALLFNQFIQNVNSKKNKYEREHKRGSSQASVFSYFQIKHFFLFKWFWTISRSFWAAVQPLSREREQNQMFANGKLIFSQFGVFFPTSLGVGFGWGNEINENWFYAIWAWSLSFYKYEMRLIIMQMRSSHRNNCLYPAQSHRDRRQWWWHVMPSISTNLLSTYRLTRWSDAGNWNDFVEIADAKGQSSISKRM